MFEKVVQEKRNNQGTHGTDNQESWTLNGLRARKRDGATENIPE